MTRAIERLAKFERGDAVDERVAKLRRLLEGLRLDATGDALANCRVIPISQISRWKRVSDATNSLPTCKGGCPRWLARKPVLLAVEDVQWIDPTSEELLRQLSGSADRLSMLLVLTLRTDGEPEEAVEPASALTHMRWLGEGVTKVYELTRLRERDIEALIAAVAEDRLPPERIVTAIAVRSEGNPLFIEELTRGWLEATRGGPLQQMDPSSRDMSPVGIPDSLSSALMARVDQLGTARELALKAAVIGAEFTASLLSRVADVPGRGVWVGLATRIDHFRRQRYGTDL
jgi:hypothetical protein